jgi:hypothetical protein
MKKLLIILLMACSLSSFSQEYKSHWSFRPIVEPDVPALSIKGTENPIDKFVGKNLLDVGIVFQKEASKRNLIRRLTYDLTGLPPTYQQVKDFERGAISYEYLVDHLLGSDRYGERYARHWMDVVRYSDTRGVANRRNENEYTYAWTYRQWIIESLNENMPFDKFMRLQISADLMYDKSEARLKDLAALGFLAIGKYDRDANQRIDEKIDTTSKAMLGLTVACARCHDHKFDPISIEDYYGWHGIFSNLKEINDKDLPVIQDVKTIPQYKDYFKRYVAATNKLYSFKYSSLAKWNDHSRSNASAYVSVAFVGKHLLDAVGFRAYIQTNKIDKIGLMNGTVRKWQREMGTKKALWEAYRLYGGKAKITSDDLAKIKSPIYRSFFQKERVDSNRKLIQSYRKLFDASYSFSSRWIRSKKRVPTGDEISKDVWREAVPILYSSTVGLGTIDNFQNSLPTTDRNRYNREVAKLKAVGRALEQAHPGAPRRPQMLLGGRSAVSKVLFKGNPALKGDLAPKGYIDWFDDKNYSSGSGRYALAKSIASPDNVLSPRSIVNRVWQWHFGSGFVDDPDNLGMLSNTPKLTNLVDYLSVYLVKNKWNIKRLHRLILTSQTYRQSSVEAPRHMIKDSDNSLMHKQNIRKLSFEELRDSLLYVAKQLDEKHDGRPVNLMTSFKRSVYGRIDRSNIPELLAVFDFSNPNMPSGKRPNTTVPQQALFLMNGQFVDQRVKGLAALPEIKRAIDEESKVTALYRSLFQRDPSPLEIKLGIRFMQKEGPERYVQTLLMSNEFNYVF